MIDLLLTDVAKMAHEERLQQAERWYNIQQAPTDTTGVVDNLLLGLSRWLIGAGEQLRQRAEMRPSLR